MLSFTDIINSTCYLNHIIYLPRLKDRVALAKFNAWRPHSPLPKLSMWKPKPKKPLATNTATKEQ